MAIKNIIASGIGFTPGSVKFIPTHGFIAASVVAFVNLSVRPLTLALKVRPGTLALNVRDKSLQLNERV